MSDQETTTSEPAPLESEIRDILEDRDKRNLDAIRDAIHAAAGTPAPEDVARAERVLDEPERQHPVVSRNQPRDGLYRGLVRSNPELATCRSAVMDHHNAEWLRGLVDRDRTRMLENRDKANAAYQRVITNYTVGSVSGTATPDGTAGEWMPQPLAEAVMISLEASATYRGVVRMLQMTGPTLRVPTMSAFTAEIAAEGAISTGAGPADASKMFVAKKAQAYATLSNETIEDSAFNLVGMLAERAGMGLGALQDTEISLGTSITGSIVASVTAYAELSSTVITYEDVQRQLAAVPKQYRSRAVWFAGNLVIQLLSQMQHAGGPALSTAGFVGNPISDIPGFQGTVLGRPVFEVPLAAGELLCIDPGIYGLAMRSGITAAVSTEVLFATDGTAIKFTERYDGQLLETGTLAGARVCAGLLTAA